MDKRSRHGGQVLNARDPSAMSPTNVDAETLPRCKDYRLKYAVAQSLVLHHDHIGK